MDKAELRKLLIDFSDKNFGNLFVNWREKDTTAVVDYYIEDNIKKLNEKKWIKQTE
tara:strand:+ start:331 stop:498 length:168 start_codon:yes stop_codon:yes gene_type:complete